ncbi:MAG TPA: MFS transporter, partial [Kiloniellales bacterium]
NATQRGKALGVNGIFGGVGVAASGLVAGVLIDAFGWRAAFMVPGVVSLATGLALAVCLRLGLVAEGEAVAAKEAPPGRGDMLRTFLILLLTMMVMGVVFQGTQAAMPKVFDLRLRDIAGDGAFGIGVIVALVYTVGSIMQLAGGHMADKYPLKPIYVGAFLFQIPVMAGFALLGGMPLIGVAMLAVLLSTGSLPAENMLLARYTPARHHGLAYGIKYVLAFGTAPLSLMLVSAIQARTGEFAWLFLILAALAGLATLAALLLPGEWRRAVPLAAPAE